MGPTTSERFGRWSPLAAGACLAALAWYGPGPSATLAVLGALGLVVIQIAWQDLSDFTISDAAVLALGLVGLASRLGQGLLDDEPLVRTLALAALDGAFCGGSFLLLREAYYRRRGYDGLGFGDVKLALAGGFLVGIEGFAWATFGASLGGLALALGLRRTGGDTAGGPERLAFGALLAPALWLAWILTVAVPEVWGAPCVRAILCGVSGR